MKSFGIDLWFDGQALEAADFYTSVFDNSKILHVTDYGPDQPGPEGEVMYVQFELDGQIFGAVNGGPQFTFSPAMSIVVNCEDQDEVDRYWNKLSAVPEAEQCGWVQDKFGVSWQIVPTRFGELMTNSDPKVVDRVMQAMLKMHKLDIAELEKAAIG